MAGVLIETPDVHERADGDVKSALAESAVFHAGGKQVEQLFGYGDRVLGCFTVHPAPLAFGPVIGKERVEPARFVESVVRGGFHFVTVFVVEHDRISGTHGVGAGFEAQQIGGLRGGEGGNARNKTRAWRFICAPTPAQQAGLLSVLFTLAGHRMRRPHNPEASDALLTLAGDGRGSQQARPEGLADPFQLA